MDDAGLHHGLGKHRGDRFRKTLEPVDHRDQDILDPAAAQFRHHPQPELGPLGLLDPQPENFLVAGATKADRQVQRPVADQTLIADFYSHRIEENNRIGRVPPAALPRRHFLQHRVSHRAHQVR